MGNYTPCRTLGANPGPSVLQACELTTRPWELHRRGFLVVFQIHPWILKVTQEKNHQFWPEFGRFWTVTQFEFTDGFEMMHKAWCCIEEMPHCFSRSCIKFRGHTGQKFDDLNKIWERLLGRSQLSNPSDLPCVTLKFHIWPWKIIGHIFYATSSFVHHLVAICEFKLELRYGHVQIGAKFVLTSVTLTSDLDLLHGHCLCQCQLLLMRGVCDEKTDRIIHRAAWSWLKFKFFCKRSGGH